MTLYQKITYVFGIIRDLISLKASKNDVASPFVGGRSYKKGDLVSHDGKFYICTEAYSGHQWNASYFSESNVNFAIGRKADRDDFATFDEITVDDAATQDDVRRAVQGIIQKLQSIST